MMRVTNFLLVLTFAACTLLADSAQRDAGIAAFNNGRYSIALQQLSAAALDKSDSTAQLFLALTQAAVGDCASALPTLVQEPLDRLAGIAAVNCFAASGVDNREFTLLNELQKKFPGDADVLYLTARQHMRAFNDATYAMFQRAPSSYRVHELSAEIFEIQNRFGEAISEYRKAITLNPSAPDLHFRLGRALLLQSHDSDTLRLAAAEFHSELELSPEDAACEFQLGQIAQVETKTADAQTFYRQALKLSPDFVQALLALGKIEAAAKNYAEAVKLLVRAIQLQPDNEAAHYALLTVYRDSGRLKEAKDEKVILDRLQKPEEGEFTNFLKRLGEKPAQP